MLERQPSNREQFSRLNGVGESKLDKYAAAFLSVINDHINQEQHGITDSVTESLILFRRGLDINSIAAQRELKITTIYSHLASCIEQGELKLEDVVDLNEQDLTLIHEAFLSLDDGTKKLKPIYDALEGMFDYGILRCVQAAVQ